MASRGRVRVTQSRKWHPPSVHSPTTHTQEKSVKIRHGARTQKVVDRGFGPPAHGQHHILRRLFLNPSIRVEKSIVSDTHPDAVPRSLASYSLRIGSNLPLPRLTKASLTWCTSVQATSTSVSLYFTSTQIRVRPRGLHITLTLMLYHLQARSRAHGTTLSDSSSEFHPSFPGLLSVISARRFGVLFAVY